MLNAPAPAVSNASEFAGLACEHLDDLCTYAAHLVGEADDALEFVAAGISHAMRFPPARVRVDGRVALLRSVTNACRHELRFPPRPTGAARIFRRHRPTLAATAEAQAAQRINTVKRALGTLPFERRAAILLRDLERLTYREISRALECSPDNAARLVAGARREFGSVYREIAL